MPVTFVEDFFTFNTKPNECDLERGVPCHYY